MTDTPVIRFDGVGLTYPGPPPVTALRDCRMTVERGEFVAVVGPSGSGKSTFLNLAGLLDRPTTGTYELDGIDVRSLSETERTALRGRRLGFVFQAFHLLPYRTALENVALAQLYSRVSAADRRKAAAEALRRVGLGHRMHALPTTLSGGERQRVAIARALVNRPSLLLCDEPTGSLDTSTAGTVMDLLAELNSAGLTIVVITHDLHVAGRADRILAIRDGRLSADRPSGQAASAPQEPHAHAG
ncbi:ABC transporter ATP-binding protein [Yinghuangia soli]|uniref:ABC transporter ATP-binding protein n=1 Tax=Yinghuangia soli TaxID=2908204 RepID=A0AA41Q260_9ACTN|nr:ABC transporter ATP-binding protein [Yinghuangia soli]MCF2529550.1 ABC transporter ATP-binding protein [Yinghuangia soli]